MSDAARFPIGNTFPPGASSLNLGPGYYASVGTTLLGFSQSDPRIGKLENHFAEAPTPPGFTNQVAGSGTQADVSGASAKGGVSRLSSTTTAGSLSYQFNTGRIVGSTSVDKWYFAWRFRTPTSVDANSRIWMGLRDFADNGSIYFGVRGDSSQVNLIFGYDGHPVTNSGTVLSLSVAIDTTTWHIVEAWHPGDGKYHYRIDGGAEFTPVTPSSPISQCLTTAAVYGNGASGHADNLDRDWFVYLFPQAV